MPSESRFLRGTQSVCPVCLRTIPASIEEEGNNAYLAKRCPKHGLFRCIIWRGNPGQELSRWSRPKIPSRPRIPATAIERGCPYDCGLCPDHRQHTCTALLEITWRCNLACPVCFASAGVPKRPDLTKPEVEHMLREVMRLSGPCNIQFSGGEPSIHPDLPFFISLAKQIGFPFVQLNTNGLRAAREKSFAPAMARAGLDSVFLQFDSHRPEPYEQLRGASLLEEKLLAVERFIAAGIGVVLVPTVIPGVNDQDLGGLLELAASRSPGVRGIHFQPVSYFGRFPASPADQARITLPEVMRGLEEQTNGLIHARDFLPPACEHARCSFHANYLVNEDQSLTLLSEQRACCSGKVEPIPAKTGADQSKAFVSRQWSAPTHHTGTAPSEDDAAPKQSPQPAARLPMAPHGTEKARPTVPMDDLDRFLARAATHRLAVSAMAFQDAWSLDLDRLRGCCIHVVTTDGRLIPFCAYNLTAVDGRPLYRNTHGHAVLA
ncbi:hypothetical protein SAMN02745704_01817 [Paucidesulfovibrio gracilis DSM 16080]|uniref:Radical SAM core domain-containing protein n=1 Tax=Paucidesulfovibrio gracilis DSM 16080 TaxID=1121449 RepID=A0A1T4X6P3_9BACT|nr:radical SAM (seleno)protein TrsS [Paucidesulfovibrio gracilis]SKA84778.1 hypothetical protein SAMN02745704_01817 [Paucidesulfovibrio gracilis DSM 16080]